MKVGTSRLIGVFLAGIGVPLLLKGWIFAALVLFAIALWTWRKPLLALYAKHLATE